MPTVLLFEVNEEWGDTNQADLRKYVIRAHGQDGNYEIYIYSPVGGISKTIKVQRDPYALAKLKYMQYYTVKSGVNVYSAELNVRERTLDSWFLLGQFYLEKGKLSIELSDKGSEIDQIIQGDAVKIVYVSK